MWKNGNVEEKTGRLANQIKSNRFSLNKCGLSLTDTIISEFFILFHTHPQPLSDSMKRFGVGYKCAVEADAI